MGRNRDDVIPEWEVTPNELKQIVNCRKVVFFAPVWPLFRYLPGTELKLVCANRKQNGRLVVAVRWYRTPETAVAREALEKIAYASYEAAVFRLVSIRNDGARSTIGFYAVEFAPS